MMIKINLFFMAHFIAVELNRHGSFAFSGRVKLQ